MGFQTGGDVTLVCRELTAYWHRQGLRAMIYPVGFRRFHSAAAKGLLMSAERWLSGQTLCDSSSGGSTSSVASWVASGAHSVHVHKEANTYAHTIEHIFRWISKPKDRIHPPRRLSAPALQTADPGSATSQTSREKGGLRAGRSLRCSRLTALPLTGLAGPDGLLVSSRQRTDFFLCVRKIQDPAGDRIQELS